MLSENPCAPWAVPIDIRPISVYHGIARNFQNVSDMQNNVSPRNTLGFYHPGRFDGAESI